ncbi:MAG TPA: 5-formyltetrahydrofolate cyclo-ligase [Gammaproteobacteria bacterium]|nr:5-formyltetrahydrofolate cyclo-ligase [Gammaproteobacteria bacterium]
MKNSLRHQIKNQLRTVTSSQKLQAEARWLDAFISHCGHLESFGFYYPMSYEPNVLPLIQYCWSKSKKVYLPVLSSQGLVWKSYQADTALVRSSLGFLEPLGEVHSLTTMTAVIVPFLGVNQQGFRLGQGKGYFDKTMSAYKGQMLGFGYDFQRVSFEEDDWDMAFTHCFLVPVNSKTS